MSTGNQFALIPWRAQIRSGGLRAWPDAAVSILPVLAVHESPLLEAWPSQTRICFPCRGEQDDARGGTPVPCRTGLDQSHQAQDVSGMAHGLPDGVPALSEGLPRCDVAVPRATIHACPFRGVGENVRGYEKALPCPAGALRRQ